MNTLLKSSLVAATISLATFALAAAETPLHPTVRQIKLDISNAFLIKSGNKNVLIDTGSKKDMPALEAALAKEGVSIENLNTVIITHGHNDHAGLAAEIKRRSKAVLIAGEKDIGLIHAGHDEELKPTNLMGRILKRWAIDPVYEGFSPDVLVNATLDLRPYGIAGQVVPMPGHTPGSLVILLDDGRALVGDMMLGGWMNGAMFASSPGEHYFQNDLELNHANIVDLLKKPIHTFYLGHGGPVTRDSILDGFNLTDPLAK